MKKKTCFQLLIAAFLAAAGPVAVDAAPPAFKFYVEHSGVYAVSFDRLLEAGLGGPVDTETMGLTNRGVPVPMWVEDGGDGAFGPGDRVFFVGEVLRGDASYLDPFSRFNCYVLETDSSSPLHGSTLASDGETTGPTADLIARHHLEPDRVMVRFRTYDGQPEEEWYWERLSVADKKPFRQTVSVAGLVHRALPPDETPSFADALSESVRSAAAEGSADPSRIHSQLNAVFGDSPTVPTRISLRLGLRGWSEPRHRERDSLPHHELEIHLNGTLVDTAVWDGTDHYIHELEIPSSVFAGQDDELALKVKKRKYPESGDLVVDVVLLNWIELEYRHQPRVLDEQLRLALADPEGPRSIRIAGRGEGPVDLYRSDGVRVRSESGMLVSTIPDGVSEFSVLRPQAAAEPDEVVFDHPSDLKRPDRQADYIMITHRSLKEGADRLARFHRGRGLTVEVVDVQDIYDEFNHGIVAPRAIKDFLELAHAEWSSPAPRFVLLVGDASWDFKNTTADDSNYADWTYRPGENRKFWKNRSTSYAEDAELNHRNLVPTSSYLTTEGHAASDTWFVCFDDGDMLPDMAIGRIPVATPEELGEVVDKTIAFASAPPVGPWRRNLLFLANESVGFQRRSDKIADEYSRRGYVPTRIYPHPTEPANEHHTRRILEVFDAGVYAVHFIGHGGRYIWRTGPPDLAKNHDLFTLEHLDDLAPNDRLPIILSLTCYSAPFDHPTADSIGEKLLRVSESGAIAVFAASWRNSPSPRMGELLLAELTTPGNTIGEAVMRAKREFPNQVLIQTYNLLGDPAVPVGAPGHALDLEMIPDAAGGEVALEVKMPTPDGSYELRVDWIGADDSVLRQDRVAAGGGVFSMKLAPGVIDDPGDLAGVKVYVWDEERRIDGIGWAEMPVVEPVDGGTDDDRRTADSGDGDPRVEPMRSKGDS
jgi:hypothetical protein